MKKLRIPAALLAVLMLLGSLASCTNPSEQLEETKGAGVSENESETDLKDWLPDDLNYNGDEVTILSRYREGWTSGEISVEKTNGEAVNDAVYERNRLVEERLGVKIVSIEDHDADQNVVINRLKNAVATGTNEYDILASACYLMLNESLEGTFADLRQTEYLDFDKEWWSQGFNEAVEYKGLQFGVTGSVLLSMYRFTFVTLFNKRLFQETSVDFLYDNVRDGSWTLDYQASIVPLFHRDNGNGEQDTEGDVYGLVTGNYISVDPYWSSCQIPILVKDPDTDEYTLDSFDSGRLYDTCEKLMNMFYNADGSTYICPPRSLDGDQDDIRDMFASGNAAMATLRLMALESDVIRDMGDEYGVVPMPKFDTAQQEYKSLMHDQFTVLSVPTTIQGERLDEMSAVLEALCSESYRRVKPAYYETTLRSKLVKDPDSAEMLDFLISNIYIDPGIIYTNALGTFHNTFRQIMMSKSNTVTSKYVKVTRSAGRSLDQMTEKLNKLVDNAE